MSEELTQYADKRWEHQSIVDIFHGIQPGGVYMRKIQKTVFKPS